jgi:hypothetical protein
MSDNVTLPGDTSVIATDQVADGSHIQRVKLDLGGDGVSVPVVGAVPVSGTVALDATALAALAQAATPATQAVSASALPLPSGASTEATVAALLVAAAGRPHHQHRRNRGYCRA